jgi:hypothetical protein
MENKKIIIYNDKQTIDEPICIDIPTAISSMLITISMDCDIMYGDYTKLKESLNHYLNLFEETIINNNENAININSTNYDDLSFLLINGLKLISLFF